MTHQRRQLITFALFSFGNDNSYKLKSILLQVKLQDTISLQLRWT